MEELRTQDGQNGVLGWKNLNYWSGKELLGWRLPPFYVRHHLLLSALFDEEAVPRIVFGPARKLVNLRVGEVEFGNQAIGVRK